MSKFSLKPNKHLKHLGQNFLTSKKIVEDIIRAADLEPDDVVLEVGPGQFMLSLPVNQLPEKCKIGWPHTIRIERCIEFNAIGNLYDPNRGKFNTWEWFGDRFKEIFWLNGGNCDYGRGGLVYVKYEWPHNPHDDIAARPLVNFSK